MLIISMKTIKTQPPRPYVSQQIHRMVGPKYLRNTIGNSLVFSCNSSVFFSGWSLVEMYAKHVQNTTQTMLKMQTAATARVSSSARLAAGGFFTLITKFPR